MTQRRENTHKHPHLTRETRMSSSHILILSHTTHIHAAQYVKIEGKEKTLRICMFSNVTQCNAMNVIMNRIMHGYYTLILKKASKMQHFIENF